MKHASRIKSREPRGRAFYCACDRSKIRGGSKCPTCGLNSPPREKKPSRFDLRQLNEKGAENE